MVNDILKIASIYTAIILGAGFASGQEIATFFTRHGSYGLVGILISGVIFSTVGYIILDIAETKRIDTANVFGHTVFKQFMQYVKFINEVFLFIVYFTMLSASGATLNQEFNCHYIWGILFMAVICIIAYRLGTNFVAKINFLICPILFVGIILTTLITIKKNSISVFVMKNKNWLKDALLYPAYNIVPSISVLVPIINTVRDKKNAKYGAAVGGVFMTILGLLIALALPTNFKTQIPMLTVADNLSAQMKYFYLLIFLLAMFSTAIGSFFGLCEQLQKRIPCPDFFVLIGGILFANIDFASLVAIVFPIFGYIGLAQIILIFAFYWYASK